MAANDKNQENYVDQSTLTPILQRIETKLGNRYTKAEVDSAIQTAIAGVTEFDYFLVDQDHPKPQTGSKGVIYLVPNGSTGANRYDEEIWLVIDGEGRYENLGPASVDLANYVNLIVTDSLGTLTAARDANNEHKFTISLTLAEYGGLKDTAQGLSIKKANISGHQSGVVLEEGKNSGLRVGLQHHIEYDEGGESSEYDADVYAEQMVLSTDSNLTRKNISTSPAEEDVGKIYKVSTLVTATAAIAAKCINVSEGDKLIPGTLFTCVYSSQAKNYRWAVINQPAYVGTKSGGGLSKDSNGDLYMNVANGIWVNPSTGLVEIIHDNTLELSGSKLSVNMDMIQPLTTEQVNALLALLPSDS